jgi:hypothetical protein
MNWLGVSTILGKWVSIWLRDWERGYARIKTLVFIIEDV